MRRIAIIIALLLLTGCATTKATLTLTRVHGEPCISLSIEEKEVD